MVPKAVSSKASLEKNPPDTHKSYSSLKSSLIHRVWSEGTLIDNVSSARPELTVGDLPPDKHFLLMLYAVTPHARSKPLRLHARTPPHPSIHLKEPSTIVPAQEDPLPIDDSLWGALDGTVGGLVGGLLGGMGVLLLLFTLAVVVVRLKHHQQGDGGVGEGGSPSTNTRPLHHDLHHSTSHSSLTLESRASVYCVGGSGEERGSDTPWQETSITPLVALTTPLTPLADPQVSTQVLEDTCTNDSV
ncbi:hypothetical protein Hamer_G004173 [Homarus americanus]|uniref:Uncharacterized protein n=1 Tax=Homarus americanus TaxID=6706 RepID=A0A8J5MQ05_HOMAM|nr:hypothetical protein Hamer_G004173 [Homarus americanus]